MYSLIIPVYQNEKSIPDLMSACEALSFQLKQDTLEVVLVVDASRDDSFAVLSRALEVQKFSSQLILHARNLGSFAAIRTGLEYAKGDYFSVMAADMQDPIDVVLQFYKKLSADEADVVVGIRDSRSDPFFSKIFSELFWWLYRQIAQKEIPPGGVDLFGCNRAFRDRLLLLKETRSSLVGMIFWMGHRRSFVKYARLVRKHGKSAWSLRKKMNYFMDSVFAFTMIPIHVLTAVGLVGIGASTVLGTTVLAYKIFGKIDVPGYAALIVTIVFFGALNCFGIGIVGQYVARAYENTKGRPLSLVLETRSFSGAKAGT